MNARFQIDFANQLEAARGIAAAGQPAAGCAECERAAGLASANGEWHWAVELSIEAANMAVAAGNLEQAYAMACQAERWASAQELDKLLCDARIARARLAWQGGDYHGALADLEQAWPGVSAIGDATQVMRASTMHGLVYGDLNQPDNAQPWFQSALDAAKRSGRPRDIATATANLPLPALLHASEAVERGDEEATRTIYLSVLDPLRHAIRVATEAGHANAHANSLRNLAKALTYLGRWDEAERALSEDDDARVHDALDNGLVKNLVERVRLAMLRGDCTQAERQFDRLVELAHPESSPDMAQRVYRIGAAVAERRGDFQCALSRFKAYHDAERRLGLSNAELSARLLAVRLETTHARADAERMRKAAHSDALTGLLNRRAMDERLVERHSHARAHESPMCTALLDIDHFKQVNDRFGHAIGDAVLKRVGELLTTACRDRDLVGRWGGEEFLVIIADVELDAALRVLERVRRRLQDEHWGLVAPGLVVTASFGVADFGCWGTVAEALVLADEALYRAKRAGKNRIEFVRRP